MAPLKTFNDDLQRGIDHCLTAARVCAETLAHSLEDEFSGKGHITLLQICGEICQTTARALIMGLEFQGCVCELCADLCDACAEDCEATSQSKFMSRCATVCRDAARSCRQIAGETQAGFEVRTKPPRTEARL